jgi:hypothetical protein
MFRPWSRNIALLVKQKRNREVWALLKRAGIFNGEFENFVDAEVAKAKLPEG